LLYVTVDSLTLLTFKSNCEVEITLIALSCLCFATIDQFLSLTIQWRHLSHRRIAMRLMTFTLIFWCLYGIPFILFFNNIFSFNTGTWTYGITNPDLVMYFIRFHIPFLLGFLRLIQGRI
jgi:hypothetical protein